MPPKLITASTFAKIKVVPRGKRGWSYHDVRVDYPVQVETLTLDKAPVVFTVRLEGGEFPYRLVEGELYRPLMDMDREPADFGAEGLEIAAIRLRAQNAAGLTPWQIRWNDDPFGARTIGGDPGRAAYQMPSIDEIDLDGGRLVEDPRREIASAGARVSLDLLEIDGIMHVRAQEPAWGLHGHVDVRGGISSIRLWLPDMPEGFDNHAPLVCVPMHRRDDAVELATLINRQVAEQLRTRDIPMNPERGVEPTDVVEFDGYEPAGDVESYAVAQLTKPLYDHYREAEFRKASVAKLRWCADLFEIREHALEGRGSMEALVAVSKRLVSDAGLPQHDGAADGQAIQAVYRQQDVLVNTAGIPELWNHLMIRDLALDSSALRID